MLTELSFLDGLSLWAFMFAESPRDLNFTGNQKEETSIKNTSTVGQARDQTKKTTPPFLHNASLLGDIFSPQTLKDVRTRRGENHLIMFTQIVQLASLSLLAVSMLLQLTVFIVDVPHHRWHHLYECISTPGACHISLSSFIVVFGWVRAVII